MNQLDNQILGDFQKKVEDFLSQDFPEEVDELVVYDVNRERLVELKHRFEGRSTGYYDISCSLFLERDLSPSKRYGLKIQFDPI